MPVLDTLLISAFLHPDIVDHDLDAIAARAGVPIAGRHTALGDAMATAAAFDMTFLRMKQAESGAVFDMPVLDTLLISAFLYPDIQDHDLDAIAARIGVPIVGRHTALGDAMATAAVFTGLIDLLERRGVATLDQLLKSARMAFELRARSRDF